SKSSHGSQIRRRWVESRYHEPSVPHIQFTGSTECFDKSCGLAARRALEELDPSLTLEEREPEEAIG
ncbi:hypothetical protein Tco_0638715, partial [Tanacetum coccineum]